MVSGRSFSRLVSSSHLESEGNLTRTGGLRLGLRAWQFDAATAMPVEWTGQVISGEGNAAHSAAGSGEGRVDHAQSDRVGEWTPD